MYRRPAHHDRGSLYLPFDVAANVSLRGFVGGSGAYCPREVTDDRPPDRFRSAVWTGPLSTAPLARPERNGYTTDDRPVGARRSANSPFSKFGRLRPLELVRRLLGAVDLWTRHGPVD